MFRRMILIKLDFSCYFVLQEGHIKTLHYEKFCVKNINCCYFSKEFDQFFIKWLNASVMRVCPLTEWTSEN